MHPLDEATRLKAGGANSFDGRAEASMDAVYRVEGRCADTRPSAAGPWHPTMQHGAAPAALVAWAAGRLDGGAEMRIARMTLDLLRPVPIAPLGIRSEVVRRGRKIEAAAISLVARGVEVVRASVLKVRTADSTLPENPSEAALDVPGPEFCCEPSSERRIRCAFLDGVSARIVADVGRRPGRGAIWFRANQPIVEGETIAPAMRAAIAADFCNGVSAALDPKDWSFINGDVTLNLVRLPVGEWILVNAETSLGGNGSGLAVARLADTTGYFGRAAQSLIVERR